MELESYAQVLLNQLSEQPIRSAIESGIRLNILDKSGYIIFT